MNQEQIGSFIKEIRKEKGFTQEQLAEKVGVSQKSISRWETGKTMPDYALLPILCDVLEINVAELLGAQRIEGDLITKNQATTLAQNMISLAHNKSSIRRIICALLSAILTLICVFGLYNYEFNVSVDSTDDLEKAINDYHFAEEVSVDILERKAIGNRLFVLYGEKDYPGACGLASLEKGMFNRYRILSCDDSNPRRINVRKFTIGKKDFFATYCADDLMGITAYELYGVKDTFETNCDFENGQPLYKLDYVESPFLTFTEIEEGVVLFPYNIHYYQGETLLSDDDLDSMLGPSHVEGAPHSGYGTAELKLVYIFEAVILVTGFLFIRYFLTDKEGNWSIG